MQRPNEAASLVFRLWIINEDVMARKRLTNLCSLLGCVRRFHTPRMQLLTCTSRSVNNTSFLRETWIDSPFLQVTARKFPLPSSFANKTLRHFRLNMDKTWSNILCFSLRHLHLYTLQRSLVMKFSVCPSNWAKKIATDSGNSGFKVEQLFKVYLCLEDIIVCHKAEIYRLLSLSSITCRNEYLALLTKRTKLYFLVAKFQDILRMSSPLKSALK